MYRILLLVKSGHGTRLQFSYYADALPDASAITGVEVFDIYNYVTKCYVDAYGRQYR